MANIGRHKFRTAGSVFPDKKHVTNAESESAKGQISYEKLEDLRDILKTAVEEYVYPNKSFMKPTTLEDELQTYTAKLIGKVKMAGGTAEIGEQQLSNKLKPRITKIGNWLEKLKEQVEDEQFEPTVVAENKDPETREISTLMKDLCMKLSAKQNEKMKQLQELASGFVEGLSAEAVETWNPNEIPNVNFTQAKEVQPSGMSAEICSLRECLNEHQRQREVRTQTVKELEKASSELWILLTNKQINETVCRKQEATKQNQQHFSSKTEHVRRELEEMATWVRNARQAVDDELKCLENEVLNLNLNMTVETREEPDTPRMLVRIRRIREQLNKTKKTIENRDKVRQTEDNDELAEFLSLIHKSLISVKEILLSEPFLFENPGKGQKDVEEFSEKFRTPLLDAVETENIMTKNAKLFSNRFVETSVVIAQLREMFSAIMKEEVTIENNRQENEQRKGQNKKASKEVKMPISITEFTESITQKFVEHGMTIKEMNKLCKLKDQRINALEQKTKDLQCRIERLTKDLKQREADLSEQRRKANENEKERQELLTRLSKEASAKLTDNNPNIADLSDINRPAKLAEKYSELYDNEWTDTYDVLVNSSFSSQEALTHLYNIFVEIFEECGKYAQRQDFVMRSILVCPTTELVMDENSKVKGGNTQAVELRSVLSKEVSEVRKQSVIECAADMSKHLQATKEEWFKTKAVGNYANECIKLCWRMQVQSPPIDIDTDTPPGAKFDKDKYKEYTKTGKTVEFVVWPTLFLSKGGPVLWKGVAQGK